MTREGDLVLTHIKNNPAFFARIEHIEADTKPDWFQVRMLVLQVPLVTITWILREAYINGEEFTMGGHPVKLVKVVAPEQSTGQADTALPHYHEARSLDSTTTPNEHQSQPLASNLTGPTKVVSLADRRKKHPD